MVAQKILIVEDEGIAAMNLERTLDDLGYASAGIAFSAAEAIEKAKLMRPALVLMDIQLAGNEDGIEAAGEIQEKLGTPVVFLTAFSDDQTIRRAKTKGPFGFLLKPVQEQALKSTIEVAIQKHRIDQSTALREAHLRNLVEHSPAGMIQVDGEDKILSVNTAFAAILGYEPRELVHRFLIEFLPFAERGTYLARHTRIVHGAIEAGFDLPIVSRSGGIVWVHATGKRNETPGGEVTVNYAVVDISQRQAREKALRDETEVLMKNHEELQQFAGLVSTDLKAPIQRAAHELQQIVAGAKPSELGNVQQELDLITGMLEGLNDFSRALPKPKQLKPVPLMRVVGDAITKLRPLIDEKGAKISYRFLPTVMAVESQCRKVFENIIGNALKYNLRRPEIAIQFEEQEKEFLFSIRDNGIGIQPELVGSVFEVFSRIEKESIPAGAGMGLAVCRKVIENLGGRIWVESIPELGSVFYFTLPRSLSA